MWVEHNKSAVSITGYIWFHHSDWGFFHTGAFPEALFHGVGSVVTGRRHSELYGSQTAAHQRSGVGNDTGEGRPPTDPAVPCPVSRGDWGHHGGHHRHFQPPTVQTYFPHCYAADTLGQIRKSVVFHVMYDLDMLVAQVCLFVFVLGNIMSRTKAHYSRTRFVFSVAKNRPGAIIIVSTIWN